MGEGHMTASNKAGSFRPHEDGSLNRDSSRSGRGSWRPAAQGVAIALAAMSGTALAQQQGALEEVIVTAEFRQANVQDTPIAITAVTSSMMEARSKTNVFEIAAQAPNVTLKPAGAGIGPAMIAFIRGIGQTDFNYALEPGVGVYVDDVYYPTRTGTLLDLLDLDRVEVLRGPQATLARKHSGRGSYNLYPRQPSAENGGSIGLTYGSFDRVEFRGSGDFTIVEDKLYARVAGVSRSRDGYVTRLDYRCVHPDSNVPTFSTGHLSNCELGKEGGQNYTGGRVNLSWTPSDAVRVTLIADAINDESQAQPNVLIRVNEALARSSGPWEAGEFQGISIPGTDGNPVHLTNAFVPYGPWRGDPVVNDGYVSYATYMDPHGLNIDTQRRYSPVAIPPITTLDQRGISATIDWQINDRLSLKSITAVREYQSSFAQDVDGSPVNSQMLLQHLDHEQKSQELRLSGTAANDRLDYTVG